jgi:hypothetical protein
MNDALLRARVTQQIIECSSKGEIIVRSHAQTTPDSQDESAKAPGENLLPQNAKVPAIIQQAHAAFRHALPRLWQERPGLWVAFHGEQQIGFAATKKALYEECLGRGLRRGEFLVRCIEPEIDEIHLGPRSLE